MSSGLKSPRGSVCRLLLAKDLVEGGESGGDTGHREGTRAIPSATIWGPLETHRWVRDLSPRKVAFESAWMSLFSMNLGWEETVARPP